MKLRPYILALAAAAFLSGCGSSTDSVNVEPTPTLDTSAPAAPASIGVEFDSGLRRNILVWQPSSAGDVAGYEVHIYDPDPLRESAYTLYGQTDAGTTRINLPYVGTTITEYVRIRAIDDSGNLGAFTDITPVELGVYEPAGGPGRHYDDP